MSQCHRDGLLSAGPIKVNGLPEAHQPPHGLQKSIGPGVIVPPAPLSVALI